MKQCRECELAIYCYSESSSWVFRSKEEMSEKLEMIHACPLHSAVPGEEPAPCHDERTSARYRQSVQKR